MKFTLKDVKIGLKAVGVGIKKTPDGEYRVSIGDKESSAYYTDDLKDAFYTGLQMAKTKRNQNPGFIKCKAVRVRKSGKGFKLDILK